MEYLDRYLFKIGCFLKRSERKQVLQIVKKDILRKLEGSKREDIVMKAIKEYGNPIDVASRLTKKKRLISIEYRPVFNLIIVFMSISLPITLVIANTFTFIQNGSYTFIDILVNMSQFLPEIIIALLMGTFLVTLLFSILTIIVKPKYAFQDSVFDPEKLPKHINKNYRVLLIEEYFIVFAGLLFIYVLNRHVAHGVVDILGISTPIFTEDFQLLVPFINLSTISIMGLALSHIMMNRKNKASIHLQVLFYIVSSGILILLATNTIINPDVVTGLDLGVLLSLVKTLLWIGGIGGIIGQFLTFIRTI